MSSEQFEGCLLGLALGDALGAPHEGGILERTLWRVLGRTADGKMRWTDDTQMSLDVADSLLAHGGVAPDDIARRFADSYRWRRGYGPGAAKVLKRIRGGEDWRSASRAIYPEGSYGNGGAMRSPVLGLFFAGRPDALRQAVDAVARITHAHRLAIDGAQLVAAATALALQGQSAGECMATLARIDVGDAYLVRLRLASDWLASGEQLPVRQVVAALGNGIAAIDSCVTALYVALRFRERGFAEMLAFITDGGGDADTIAAMAGAIWGAANGAGKLPQASLDRLEQCARVRATGAGLYLACQP